MKLDRTKVLFLDIDGVLNNAYGDNVIVHGVRSHNAICIGNLNYIIAETDCSLVITSTWRIGKSPDFLAGILYNMGVRVFRGTGPKDLMSNLSHRVIGKTNTLVGSHRGDEIAEFLRNVDIRTFAIVDDQVDACQSDSRNDLHNHFVKTEDIDGLTMADASLLVRTLNA